MTPQERVLTALKHREPDRVPFDLGSTVVTGITRKAYLNLLNFLGIKKDDIGILDIVQQLADVDEEVLRQFKVDIRGIFTKPPSDWQLEIKEKEDYYLFQDQWGIVWRMPRLEGLYFDMYQHPLSDITNFRELERVKFPNPSDPARVGGLREQARQFCQKEQTAVIVGGSMGGGFFEMAFWLRGWENFYTDLVLNPTLVCALMDKLVEIKMKFWDLVLAELRDYVHMVMETEDLGDQKGPMISPEMFRKFVKPRMKELYSYIKKKAPVYIFFHSCGAIYDFIPDLIEVGVDILNPVQVSAVGMNTRRLKKDFGNTISFWGGGVDTQRILPLGTPQQVKDEVKRRIDDLAPGGGFIFNTVHNIQADVPPQNIIAMWEALQEYGGY